MNLYTLATTRLEHIRNAKLSRDELEFRQIQKFRALVGHCYKKSEYYKGVIDDFGIDIKRCVPSDFPVLTKTELMKNFDRIATDHSIKKDTVERFLANSMDTEERYLGKYRVLHTSGSSGEMGYFIYSGSEWARGIAHALRFNPFRLKKRKVAFFGATGGHYAGASITLTSRHPVLRHLYDVRLCNINGSVEAAVKTLNDYKPDIMIGYPSALSILADYQLRGRLKMFPEYVQCSGEPLTRNERSVIESAFGVPLINMYSCSEHLIMGFGMPKWGGLYLMEDDLIFELRPDSTLVTNLFNYTLPLIRYQMNDALEQVRDASGIFPFTKVKEVAARKEHVPFFINDLGEEDFISPTVICEIYVTNIRRFQLQVVDKESCFLRVCLEDGLDESAKEAALMNARKVMSDMFAEKQMTRVKTDVVVVNDIPVDAKTGKFVLVVK